MRPMTEQREEFPYGYVTVEGTVVGEDRPPTEEQARGSVGAEIGHPSGEFVIFTVRPDHWLTFDFSNEQL